MNSSTHPSKLIQLQFFQNATNRPILPVTHLQPYHELVEVVTGGYGAVQHQGQWRDIGPGDLLWHSPGDESIGRSDPKKPYGCLAAFFRVEKAEGMGIPRFSKWTDMEEIRIFMNECIRLFWNPGFDPAVLRNHIYAKLLFQVRVHELSLKQASYPGPVAAVIARIGNLATIPVGRISDLAREIGWSVPHLHAEFRKHTGMTPRQMLIAKRIQIAKERVATSTEPLKQIAIDTGFYDIAALTHAFKKHTGMTPSEFRNNRGGKPPQPDGTAKKK